MDVVYFIFSILLSYIALYALVYMYTGINEVSLSLMFLVFPSRRGAAEAG